MASEDLSDTFVGPYRISSLIFETENSKLYESFHPLKCFKLAVKAIKRKGNNEQMIEDEIALMKQLQHQNIMQLIDYLDSPSGNYKCIVMPLLLGGDLFEYINNKGKLPEVAACKIMYSVLQAVDYIHSLGVMHRDLKPENIMLKDSGDDSMEDPSVVLIDFGYAKNLRPGELADDWVGTPVYAAPEIYTKTPCMYHFIPGKIDFFTRKFNF